MIRHGHGRRGARTPEYAAWAHMLERCSNPKAAQWSNYGGRGITVAPAWRSFEAFLADVGPRPSPKHSLDRYPNNDGNYEPGNVRWATSAEQTRNRRNNRFLTIDGRTQCLTDWARENGISKTLLFSRLKLGWDPLRAVTQPVGSYRRRAA